MFRSISWYQYLSITAILLIIWYTLCILLFYRRSLHALLKGDIHFKSFTGIQKNANLKNPVIRMKNSFEVLETLVKDIKVNILEKAGSGADKDALLRQLQSQVANYDGLRQPAYQIALNSFIINHARAICDVSFTEEELEHAWEILPRSSGIAEEE
jgi:hypothetical protein